MTEFRYEHDGVGILGRGVWKRIELPAGYGDPGAWDHVRGELDAAGPDAVALGALPFDPSAPASLVIPDEILRGALPAPEPTDVLAPPDAFALVSGRSHADWCATVEAAVRAIDDGAFDKVVVAREVVVEANRPIVVADVLERLRNLYPSCRIFSIEGFVGASPELLVARRGPDIESHPLAGTYARSGDPDVDARMGAALLESAKDRSEHRYVVDAVAGTLEQLCDSLDVPEVPSIVQLRNVLHLGTRIRGRLRAGTRPSALELVAALHPTPAVAGTPTGPALAWLAANEQLARGRYAGPVGWVDAAGDGEFALGIRSAELDGNRARMIAGVGVVKGSQVESELAETQLKLQALLAAVVRP
jgi:menaquinone-specific isochorismate synthase